MISRIPVYGDCGRVDADFGCLGAGYHQGMQYPMWTHPLCIAQ
eukprot:gene25845-biopygen9323